MTAWLSLIRIGMVLGLLVGVIICGGCSSVDYILVENESTFFVPAETTVSLPEWPTERVWDGKTFWTAQTRVVKYDSWVTEDSQFWQVIKLEQGNHLTDGLPNE